ncbi:MAG: hypothetical protein AAB210_04295, partial [Deltaproteobacteria bacterium]
PYFACNRNCCSVDKNHSGAKNYRIKEDGSILGIELIKVKSGKQTVPVLDSPFNRHGRRHAAFFFLPTFDIRSVTSVLDFNLLIG